jgi:hypothetical protein
MRPAALILLAPLLAAAWGQAPSMTQTFQTIASKSEAVQTSLVSSLLAVVLDGPVPALTSSVSALSLDPTNACSQAPANVERYFNDMFLSFGVCVCACVCACATLCTLRTLATWCCRLDSIIPPSS